MCAHPFVERIGTVSRVAQKNDEFRQRVIVVNQKRTFRTSEIGARGLTHQLAWLCVREQVFVFGPAGNAEALVGKAVKGRLL